MKFTSILAPTDLSEAATTALRYARFLAEQFNAKLTVMYADPILYPIDVMPETQAIYVSSTPEHKARLKADVESYAGPILDKQPYDVIVDIGQPVHMILRAADETHADVIVMGTHALRGWRRAILGSVTEGVLHGARIPVLTVSRPQRTPVMHGPLSVSTIVCPINFSAVAHDSLHYAADLASALHAELIVVSVVEPDAKELPLAIEHRMEEWTHEIAPVPQFRQLTLRGGAAERVLDCVDDVGGDLLVIGAQHKLFREMTVIGTTTERIVRFAPCPVLTIPRERVAADAKLPEVREYAEA